MSTTISTPPPSPPPAPQRVGGEQLFWQRCDAFVAYIASLGTYLATFVVQVAAVSAEVLGFRDAAAGSATEAGNQAQAAGQQTVAAKAQADRASSEADRSKGYADQAKSLAGTGVTALSTSSLTVAMGQQTLTLPTGLAFVPGCRVAVASTADPLNVELRGTVLSYGASGALTVSVDTITGAGTFASWAIRVVPESGSTASVVSQFFTANS